MDPDNPDDWNWSINAFQYGAISPFLRPGAVLIESPARRKGLLTAAFQNPDGEIVLFIAPHAEQENIEAGTVAIEWRGRKALVPLPEGHFLATLLWNPGEDE
ncbi:MAG: hypothetical protein ACLFSZ_10235 [Puniceicoccaceae bacterium]